MASAFPQIPIVGAAAIAAHGEGWRGLGEAALAMAAGTHVKLLGIPAETPLATPKARKMMSRGAYLAARCLADLLADVSWRRGNVGYFLGVGASGGSLDDVTALLDASIVDGQLLLPRFGDRGLAACNPLLAFQLMNNFTLCHGAILEGIGGPNAALFSRGSGTTAALIEACHAIAGGDCEHAITGGADSAVHPVTRAELTREGFIARGQRPAEGAALLALGAGATGARTLGVIEGAAITRVPAIATDAPATDAPAPRAPATSADALSRATLARVLDDTAGRVVLETPDLIVVAPWSPLVADAAFTWARRFAPDAHLADISLALGDTLAASPALAWAAAIDMLVAGHGTRALVIGAGVDGDLGLVSIARGDA